jgi:hypothetical protein
MSKSPHTLSMCLCDIVVQSDATLDERAVAVRFVVADG